VRQYSLEQEPTVSEKKPVIGVTAEWMVRAPKFSDRVHVNVNYLRSVVRAGGAPLIIPASEDLSLGQRYVEVADGLLFIGGADINPETYGEERCDLTSPLAKVKEAFDIELMNVALRQNMPVLGICLSCQLLNVARGGTLHQDVIQAYPTSPLRHRCTLNRSITYHHVRIEPGSKLHSIVGREEIETNSSHHQSCKELGKGLRAVAFAEDGVIEAIESTEHDFVVGVQWHPEYLTDREEHFRLFRALVDAAVAK
jgi:putative glutamine amidotransferase